jgi:hypothetical protein
MLSFLLRRVLPGRLVPLLALWEVYTAARWLHGLRVAARRRHRPTRLVVSGEPPTSDHPPDAAR